MTNKEAAGILISQAIVLGRASGKSTLERIRIEAICKAVEALEKQATQEWISVKDILPPYNRDVLVYRPNMAMKILVDNYAWHYRDDDDEWYEDWALSGKDANGNPVVTHWAYLPQPPKGE